MSSATAAAMRTGVVDASVAMLREALALLDGSAAASVSIQVGIDTAATSSINVALGTAMDSTGLALAAGIGILDVTYRWTKEDDREIRDIRLREAEERLTRALRVHYFYPAWKNLVELYTRQRRFDDRLRLARYADGSDRDRCAVCIELARSRLETGDTGGLEAELDRCETLYPSAVERQRIEELRIRMDGEN